VQVQLSRARLVVVGVMYMSLLQRWFLDIDVGDKTFSVSAC
jgi:hypothetical protein